MEKLGSQLREIVKQKEKERREQQRSEEQKRYETARELALPIFTEMKKNLPDVFVEEANKGRVSCCVLKGMREFTETESALAQMLISWAIQNGFNYTHYPYEISDGVEDPESLYIDWA